MNECLQPRVLPLAALFVLAFSLGMHFWGYVHGYRAALGDWLSNMAQKEKARGESDGN